MSKALKITGILFILTFILSFTSSDKWLLFESEGFKIGFPVKPEVQTEVLNTAVGALTVNIFMYDASKIGKDDNLVYMAMATEYPAAHIHSSGKEKLPGFFRNVIDGAVKNVSGKLLSEKDIELDGFPGREIQVDYRTGLAIIKARFYLVKSKLYMVQTITDTKKHPNAAVDRFMDSFKLNI